MGTGAGIGAGMDGTDPPTPPCSVGAGTDPPGSPGIEIGDLQFGHATVFPAKVDFALNVFPHLQETLMLMVVDHSWKSCFGYYSTHQPVNSTFERKKKDPNSGQGEF